MPKSQTLRLDDLLAATKIGETDDWEFKSAKGGLPRSMWETYSAMANTIGGKIVLGVSEKDGVFSVDGIPLDKVPKYKKEIFDLLNNRSKINRNILASSDLSALSVAGKTLLVLSVRPAVRSEKPIHLGQNPIGNTYRRWHEGDYVCADDEVRRMMLDASEEPFDSRILEHFGFDDIHLESLDQYRNIFRSRSPQHAWNALENNDFLRKIGGWNVDRKTGEAGLTNAGLLMFGKELSITDHNAFPKFLLDYRERLDLEVRWTHRIFPDGMWEANLFQFYQRIWPRLVIDLTVPFKLKGRRRVDETPAHKALREALVNALVHTDYKAPSNIVIERYRDKFILANPGIPLLPIEQIKRGSVSECRNPTLHKMFALIGAGERAGSGYNQIQHGWQESGWRTPHFEVEFGQLERVTLTMPTMSLIPNETLNELRDIFDERIDCLGKDQIHILATALIEQEVSNARTQELLPDHPAYITHLLRKLCDDGYLVSDGKRRWASYKIAERQPVDLFAQPKGEESSSSGSGTDSSGLTDSSSGSGTDSSGLAEENERLIAIAAIAREKRRIPQSVMKDIILQLCDGRFLTLQSLAELVDRNPANIRNAYLTPMVREGLLQLKHPQKPNSPNQAYTTAQ